MDDPIPQQIRKGICLVLWRHGGGKLGKTVQLTLGDLMWHLNAIGIRASTLAVKSALTANIKGSWIQRTRIIDPNSEKHEYKLVDTTRERAQELAAELGTDLLPHVPKSVRAAVAEDIPIITIDRKETEDMPAETPVATDSDQQFIDRMLNVLVRASEAQKAIERAEQLEAQIQESVLPPQVVSSLHLGIMILDHVASLNTTPLGMMLNEKFGTQITTNAAATARTLTAHFRDALNDTK